nr:MAG TPA: hypothetical protein [Caudoviricetes sp.]
MIRVWTNKNRVKMEFKGTLTEQFEEMGYLMKEFANEALKIDEVDFLKMFIVAYEEAKADTEAEARAAQLNKEEAEK